MCQGKQAGYRRRDFTAKPVRRAQPSSRLLWVRRSTDWFQADPSEGDSRSITRRRANCPNRTQACYEIHVPQYTSGQLGRDCRVMRSEGYSERLETNWAIRTEDRRATGATRNPQSRSFAVPAWDEFDAPRFQRRLDALQRPNRDALVPFNPQNGPLSHSRQLGEHGLIDTQGDPGGSQDFVWNDHFRNAHSWS